MFDLNYFAVLVAAIGAYIVGALWYGPLFGASWKKLMGHGEGAMPANGKFSPAQAMTFGFLATLLLTFVLAIFVGALGVATAQGALILAFWIWLGFIATVLLNGVFYENKPWKLYAINASHYLVAIAVAALILALW